MIKKMKKLILALLVLFVAAPTNQVHAQLSQEK